MRTQAAVLYEAGTDWKIEDINQGYQDMHDGKNIRGVLVMQPVAFTVGAACS